MRVGRNTRDSVDTEVKRIDFEAGFLHERNYEPAQTTIYMHWNAVFSSELKIKKSGYFSHSEYSNDFDSLSIVEHQTSIK